MFSSSFSNGSSSSNDAFTFISSDEEILQDMGHDDFMIFQTLLIMACNSNEFFIFPWGGGRGVEPNFGILHLTSPFHSFGRKFNAAHLWCLPSPKHICKLCLGCFGFNANYTKIIQKFDNVARISMNWLSLWSLTPTIKTHATFTCEFLISFLFLVIS